jgi:hypothetical protein
MARRDIAGVRGRQHGLRVEPRQHRRGRELDAALRRSRRAVQQLGEGGSVGGGDLEVNTGAQALTPTVGLRRPVVEIWCSLLDPQWYRREGT